MATVTTLALSEICTDGGTQTRAALDPATVAEYADAMTAGTVFPAVTVFHDGATYWLADGFHRHAAALQAGRADVDAEIRPGTQRDAVLYACGANAAHGLRRTNADKRRAVLTLLEDEEWQHWSDGVIAQRCAVSQPFVSGLRPKEPTHNGYEIERTATRNGTTYTINTANIGRGGERTPGPELARHEATIGAAIAAAGGVAAFEAEFNEFLAALGEWSAIAERTLADPAADPATVITVATDGARWQRAAAERRLMAERCAGLLLTTLQAA